MKMKDLIRTVARPPTLPLRGLGMMPPEKRFRDLHKTGPFDIQLPISASPCASGSGALGSQTLLDTGANTGFFAFIARALNPGSVVHAFEPLARIADKIGQNRDVSRFEVSVFQATVADLPGKLANMAGFFVSSDMRRSCGTCHHYCQEC